MLQLKIQHNWRPKAGKNSEDFTKDPLKLTDIKVNYYLLLKGLSLSTKALSAQEEKEMCLNFKYEGMAQGWHFSMGAQNILVSSSSIICG